MPNGAPCFTRKRSLTDELGHFRRVVYSTERQVLDHNAEDDWFIRLALSKAWGYEEEERFLLILTNADRVISSTVHLLDTPATAVKSVTIGCRADQSMLGFVQKALSEAARDM